MCTIPERKVNDLSISFFESFFSHPLLYNLKSINLTGGEPTLRKDLPELMNMIVSHCPSLREVIINTNGFCTEQILKKVIEIYEILGFEKKLWVYVSLDALDNTAEIIRGVPQANLKAMKTIQELILLRENYSRLQIGISCTITSKNYNKLESIYQYALEKDIYTDFIYATVNTAYINSEPKKDRFELNSLQVLSVIQFFKELESAEKISSTKNYYKLLIRRLKAEKEYKACIFREGKGLLLEADGKVSLCGVTNESLLGDLQRHPVDEILKNIPKNFVKHCANCQTDSYYGWSVEAQEAIKFEMLNAIKKMRKK